MASAVAGAPCTSAAERPASCGELPPDPVHSLDGFGAALRSGATTCVAATEAYLRRIELLDGALRSFQHVAAASALRQAAIAVGEIDCHFDGTPCLSILKHL